MADQLLGQGIGFENATDTGGDGADGFELPEVKSLVKAAALEFLPQLPRAEADAGGIEGRLIEAIELKKPQAPMPLVTAERDFAPPFGGFLDLGRHGPWPTCNGLVAAFQNSGSRAGLLDHHPEDLLGKFGAGVTAERDVRQT